jgi:hypothetical protein
VAGIEEIVGQVSGERGDVGDVVTARIETPRR